MPLKKAPKKSRYQAQTKAVGADSRPGRPPRQCPSRLARRQPRGHRLQLAEQPVIAPALLLRAIGQAEADPAGPAWTGPVEPRPANLARWAKPPPPHAAEPARHRLQRAEAVRPREEDVEPAGPGGRPHRRCRLGGADGDALLDPATRPRPSPLPTSRTITAQTTPPAGLFRNRLGKSKSGRPDSRPTHSLFLSENDPSPTGSARGRLVGLGKPVPPRPRDPPAIVDPRCSSTKPTPSPVAKGGVVAAVPRGEGRGNAVHSRNSPDETADRNSPGFFQGFFTLCRI